MNQNFFKHTTEQAFNSAFDSGRSSGFESRNCTIISICNVCFDRKFTSYLIRVLNGQIELIFV